MPNVTLTIQRVTGVRNVDNLRRVVTRGHFSAMSPTVVHESVQNPGFSLDCYVQRKSHVLDTRHTNHRNIFEYFQKRSRVSKNVVRFFESIVCLALLAEACVYRQACVINSKHINRPIKTSRLLYSSYEKDSW